MLQMIEVMYEDNVLKPLMPIEWLKKREKTWVIFCPRVKRETLQESVGTLTHEEAEEMRKVMEEEIENIEGGW